MIAIDLPPPIIAAPALVHAGADWLPTMGSPAYRRLYARLPFWQRAAIMQERERIGPLVDGPMRVGQTRGTARQREQLQAVARWCGLERYHLLPAMPVKLEMPADLPADHPRLRWPGIGIPSLGVIFGLPFGSQGDAGDAAISCDPWSAYFDGSTYLYSTGSWCASVSYSDDQTFSVWGRPESDSSTRGICDNNGNRGPQVTRNSSNHLTAKLRSDAPAVILDWTGAGTFDSAAGWFHFYWHWHKAATSTFEAWVNGSHDTTAPSTLTNNVQTRPGGYDPYIGSVESGGSKWIGDIGELWADVLVGYAASTYLSGFISGGFPVDLGATGATPTGAQPDHYHSGDATDFPTNNGNEGVSMPAAAGALLTTSSACMEVGA